MHTRALEASTLQFYNEYNQWPNTGPNGEVSNREFIPFLLSQEGDSESQNPRRRRFLSIAINDDEFVDPWESPYHIRVDSDYDTKINFNGRVIEKQVIVWSFGETSSTNWVSATMYPLSPKRNNASDSDGTTHHKGHSHLNSPKTSTPGRISRKTVKFGPIPFDGTHPLRHIAAYG